MSFQVTSSSEGPVTSSATIMSGPGGGGPSSSGGQGFAKYPIGTPPVVWNTNQPLDPKDARTAMYTNVNVVPRGRQYLRKDGTKGKILVSIPKSGQIANIDLDMARQINAARAGKGSYKVLENLKGSKTVGVSIAPKPTTQEYVMKFVSVVPRPENPPQPNRAYPAYRNERSDSIKAKIERMQEKQATMNSLVGSVLTHSPQDVIETIERQQEELEELLTMAVSGKRKNVALDIETEAAARDPLIRKLVEEQEKYNKIRSALSEECAWRSHDKIKDLLSQNQAYINLYRAQVRARSKTSSTGSTSQPNNMTIPPPVCVISDDPTKDTNSIENSDANDSMEVLADCETLNITMTRLEDLMVMLAEVKKEISSTTDPDKLRELNQEAIQLIKSTNELSVLLGHTDVIDLNESFDLPADVNNGEVKDEFKFEQKVENAVPTLEDVITADKLAPVSTDTSSYSGPISTDNSSRPTLESTDYHSDSSNLEPSDSFDQRYDDDSLERMLPSGTVSRINNDNGVRTNQSMTGNAPVGTVSAPRISAPGTTVTMSGGIPSTTIAPLSGSTAPSTAQSGRPFAPQQQGTAARSAASNMQTMVLDANGARIPVNTAGRSAEGLLRGQTTPLVERLKQNLVEEIPICNCPGTARKFY